MTNIVLDTNVWRRALRDDDFCVKDAVVLNIFVSKDNLGLAVDNQGKIMEEYRDNVGGRKFELYFKQLRDSQRVFYYDSKLSNSQKEKLEEIGFHEAEDQIFLGTAYHADKILISSDGDYGIEIDWNKKDAKKKKLVYEYITDKMQIALLTSKQCVDTEYLQKLSTEGKAFVE